MDIADIYNYFNKSAQDKLLNYCDLRDISMLLPNIGEVFERDVLDGLSDEDYERLKLSEDRWINVSGITLLGREDENKYIEGVQISLVENIYDEEGELLYENDEVPVNVVAPLDDLKKAHIEILSRSAGGDYEKEWIEELSPIVESVQTLPYESMKELFKQIEQKSTELSQQGQMHDMSEVEDAILDRKPEDLNKVIAEISEKMKDTTINKEQTRDE